MWGILFGGEWYDHKLGRMVCGNNPGAIRALQWQQSFAIAPNSSVQPAHAMAPQQVMTFSKGFGGGDSASSAFYSGKLARVSTQENREVSGWRGILIAPRRPHKAH